MWDDGDESWVWDDDIAPYKNQAQKVAGCSCDKPELIVTGFTTAYVVCKKCGKER